MQTPSHLIMSAALQVPLRRFGLPMSRAGLLIGAILPDMGFLLLSLVYYNFYRITEPTLSSDEIWQRLGDLFFNAPIWIAGHNFFHSIIINGLLLIVGFVWLKHGGSSFLWWMAVSLLLHTVVDIFTHTSDGPVFLFPLSWSYRFESPISYWESGRWFTVLEYGLNGVLLAFIGRNYLKNRVTNEQATA